ncbi:hypothetical protein LY76DRAFT_650349 [Colletotrichum caudatum]|nr:hypothetical protein LY76DRAFT_650349 [Colletotrichum caudatum]
MSEKEQQRIQHSASSTSPPQASSSSSSSSSSLPIQTRYAPREAHDLLRKLQENTIEALRTLSNNMNSSSSYGGGGGGGSSSKGTSPDGGSKSHDQSAMFDGLLPRIETRGQSKHGSKKSGGGKKKEGKSSSQQYAVSLTDDKTAGADVSRTR